MDGTPSCTLNGQHLLVFNVDRTLYECNAVNVIFGIVIFLKRSCDVLRGSACRRVVYAIVHLVLITVEQDDAVSEKEAYVIIFTAVCDYFY